MSSVPQAKTTDKALSLREKAMLSLEREKLNQISAQASALVHVVKLICDVDVPVEQVDWCLRDGRRVPYVDIDGIKLSLCDERPPKLYVAVLCFTCGAPCRVVIGTLSELGAALSEPRSCVACQGKEPW